MPVTPGTLPVAGHATQIYIEVDPSGAPGVFTMVTEVTSSIDWDITRNKTEISAHGANVDSKIVSQLLSRADRTADMTYKFANTVHAALFNFSMLNTRFGIMIVGPEGTAPTADTVIESGQIVTWKQMSPARNGEYKVQWAFSPSGPLKANGTIYS